MSEFGIPDEGREAIKRLLELEPDRIVQIFRALETTGPVLIHPSARAILVDEVMGDDAVDHLDDILRFAVFPFHTLRQQSDLSASDIYSIIEEEMSQIESDYEQKCNDRKQELIALFDSAVLATEGKARGLIRARPNLVQSARIFTDVRPVFNETRDQITAHAIINTLRIRFLDGSDSKTIHLSIDPDDLEDLEEQIKRAQRKIKRIVEDGKKLGYPSLMYLPEKVQQDTPDASEDQ